MSGRSGRRPREWGGVLGALTLLFVTSMWMPAPAAPVARRPVARALEADAPALFLPDAEPPGAPFLPVNTRLSPAGRRLHGEVTPIDAASLPGAPPIASGDRVTASLRVRAASGRLLAWPAAHPWLTLDRDPDGRLDVGVGTRRLRAASPASSPAAWSTVAVVLDGPAGRATLLVDGRPVDRSVAAPFELPAGGHLAIGPASGDVADLAVWPDALGFDRLLDHHLVAEGLRDPPVSRSVDLRVRRNRGLTRFGCPRFSPDGRWLAGCHSNALVMVDRATGQTITERLEHLEPITAVDVDPTGRFVVTADGGSVAQVWRVATHRVELRIDAAHPVAGAAFSPDGRALAAWTAEGAPGRITRLPFHAPDASPRTIELAASVHHVAWSSDGSTLAVALVDAPPQLITGDRARPLALPPATAMAWSPAASVLFVGAADGSIWRADRAGVERLRPATAPRPVGALPSPSGPDAVGDWQVGARWTTFGRPAWRRPTDGRAITALAADGRWLVAGDGAGLAVIDLEGGPTTVIPHPAPVTAASLIDGRVLTGAADGVLRRFTPDGRALGHTADPRRDVEGRPYIIRAIEPAPDGGQVAVDALGGWHARLVPVAPGPAPTPPTPSTAPWSRMAVAPSGRALVVARPDGHLVGWDLDRLRRLDGFVATSPTVSLAWTPDGPVTGHVDGSVHRWHLDGRLADRLEAHAPGVAFTGAGQTQPNGGVDGVFALPDGTWVSSGRMSVKRWRGSTALATHALPHPSLQFTPPAMDGAGHLLVSTVTGLARIDPRTGAVTELSPPGALAGAPFAWLAAAGDHVAGIRHGSGGALLSIWRDGRLVVGDAPLDLAPHRLTFAPGGRRLAVAGAQRSADGEWRYPIVVLDPATGATLARVVDHRAAVSAIRFADDPPPGVDRLYSGGYDGHERVFEIDRHGARLVEQRPGCPAMAVHVGVSRVALCADRIRVDLADGRLLLADAPDGHWLIASDDGFFAASAEGDRLASAVAGSQLIGLDRVALARNRPDLIARRFGLGDEALRADLEQRVRRRLRRQGIGDRPAPLAELPRVELEPVRVVGGVALIKAGARSATGLSRWRLRADGTPVGEGPLDGRVGRFEASVPLIDGPNRLEVDVADAEGRWSPRAAAIVHHLDHRRPRLYVVAFGVSRYADPAIRDLRFAHRDALDLVERFEGQRARWGAVVTRAFVDEAVSDEAFAEAEATLAAAEPGDTVIIFVSGHGVYDAGGTYRYLVHRSRLSALEESPPFERIEAVLDATRARRRLLLLDTCESGERVAEAIPSPGATPRVLEAVGARLIRPITAAPVRVADRRDRFVDRDLRRGRGAVVFSSSRGSEASWELEALENGAFTEAVLDALGGAADTDGDGQLTLDELRRSVSDAVIRLTADRQHPTIDRENRSARIQLPVARPATPQP